jgi:hypothetical protein
MRIDPSLLARPIPVSAAYHSSAITSASPFSFVGRALHLEPLAQAAASALRSRGGPFQVVVKETQPASFTVQRSPDAAAIHSAGNA